MFNKCLIKIIFISACESIILNIKKVENKRLQRKKDAESE